MLFRLCLSQNLKFSCLFVLAAIYLCLHVSSAAGVTIEGPFMGHTAIHLQCSGSRNNHCRLMQKQGSTWKPIAIFYNSGGSHSLTLAAGTHYFRQDNYEVGGMGQQVLRSSESFSVVVPSAPTVVTTLSVPDSDQDGRLEITWSDVHGATSYALEQSLNSGAWGQSYVGGEKAYAAVLNPGTYRYRVKACRASLCTAYTTSSNLTIPMQQSNNSSRVLFIHTDLLGSSAAETDQNGNQIQ